MLEIRALKAHCGALADQRFSAGGFVDDDALERMADQVAALFTVDGIWEGGPGLGTVTGRPAIAERLREPTLTFSRHLFVKLRTQGDGARARAKQ